jgi:hypothetical protein
MSTSVLGLVCCFLGEPVSGLKQVRLGILIWGFFFGVVGFILIVLASPNTCPESSRLVLSSFMRLSLGFITHRLGLFAPNYLLMFKDRSCVLFSFKLLALPQILPPLIKNPPWPGPPGFKNFSIFFADFPPDIPTPFR